MKLYKVYRTDSVDWDEYDAFVVRAKDKEQAIELCSEVADQYMRQDSQPTFREETVEVIEVSQVGVAEVIMDSFNAG